MTREFHVLYRMTSATGTAAQVPVGPVLALSAQAEGADQLEAQFAAAGLQVVGINPVRAIVDWSLPNFDRDEAAEFLRISAQTLSINKGGGEIPWAAIGKGIYPRAWMEKFVANHANRTGKAIAEQILKRAA